MLQVKWTDRTGLKRLYSHAKIMCFCIIISHNEIIKINFFENNCAPPLYVIAENDCVDELLYHPHNNDSGFSDESVVLTEEVDGFELENLRIPRPQILCQLIFSSSLSPRSCLL